MEEIYWLQRLVRINTLMWICFGISLMVLITYLCIRMNIGSIVYYDSEKRFVSSYGKIVRCTAIITFISLLFAILIPTTEEAYMIYGIGGTIDYLKENETAKQLPDKVINALDKWIDGLNEDKEK